MKILFVCRGNVGRSQIAEALFKQITHGEHAAQSAGVEAMGSDGTDLNGMLLKDRASSKHAIEIMKEMGIDISHNYIKRLTPEMVEWADRIVVLKPEAIPEFLKGNEKVAYWDIPDPDEQTLEFYRKTRDEVKELVEKFLRQHSDSSTPPPSL